MYAGKSNPKSQYVEVYLDLSLEHQYLKRVVEHYVADVREKMDATDQLMSGITTTHNLPSWSAAGLDRYEVVRHGSGFDLVMHETSYAICVARYLKRVGYRHFTGTPGYDELLSCKLLNTVPSHLGDSGVIAGSVWTHKRGENIYRHHGLYRPGSHARIRGKFHANGVHPTMPNSLGE